MSNYETELRIKALELAGNHHPTAMAEDVTHRAAAYYAFMVASTPDRMSALTGDAQGGNVQSPSFPGEG